MLHQFSRTELAIGPEGLEIMKNSTVAVLGIGGVGGMAVEALARSGIGRLILIDKDSVDITNVNRQIHALTTTVGQKKAELMVDRVKLINPECEAIALNMFYTEETYEELFKLKPDYVIDASDTIIYKVHLIKECLARGIPMISSMGAANKMDPTRFQVADISKTTYDPIARVIRQKLRKDGIKKGVKVVFSTEPPMKPRQDVTDKIVPENAPDRRKAKQPPASNSFVPPVAGLIMVSVAVRDLLEAGGVSL
ncbi:tRNA threonylcarbamoyladenosine dehydratase [Paenibacillus sp. FSL R7-0048]|jgi:tRNA A37 threonylcarbamoyladenosine dehydratase|uniref:tRNA threonylcarbamoyladenosine dehydratase n=1 Tax=Paenibacillus TaxID=44249 RepID=UPI00096DCED7|nr:MULTISPECIES: tRNA threonylcarbamoyladenosine dehydratase [Paenibacillus]MDH6431225.1 tRNA A37 threonylcarbamoyladenosine dehydratase [Paenibacillus sp. PastH-4]MDH6447281.1 tRNA A37 threonylcarbamoyladenosine dehydratase [Paenibacillus sp. PastF-4]MDH6531429.1 tRNA A37 threonylcarbamoyladenosine dehydratase [Paenibacillus sp. PastH-3]OMC72789.1 tRNA threonylcarbamoyladenosine dehydratase [Paenibacillus odorifer]OMD56751.1 tRNA threonylcarbamoyladenosine dehydratase [Paenibacillus odorifer]